MSNIVWVIRQGSGGENEDFALENGIVGLDYSFKQSLEGLADRNAVKEAYQTAHPGLTADQIRQCAGALWRLKTELKIAQLLLLPLKKTSDIAIGVVDGPYEYHSDFPNPHCRRVKWLRKDGRKSALRPELQRQLNSYGSLFSVALSDEDEKSLGLTSAASQDPENHPIAHDGPAYANLAADARDALRRRIDDQFKLHALEELVEDVLLALGFTTLRREAKGADGGVDIIAAHGPMGMGNPRICVQVKSGTSQIGRPAVQQLLGAVTQFHAEQGLFVAWGGFSREVLAAEREQFHRLRLWDQEQLIDAILDNYEALPIRSKDKLRLKQIWIFEPDVYET